MHPTLEQLIAWVLGDADGRTRGHLARPCSVCAEQIRLIEGLLATLRSDRDPDAPANWVARAARILAGPDAVRAAVDRVREWGRGLAEVVAAVVADSAAPSQVGLGVRSGAGARRLRFESSHVELDLEMETARGGVRVTGQFASLEPEPRPLVGEPFLLVTSSGSCHDGRTDELGEFDAHLDDADGLQLCVIHRDRIHSFVVPEPRLPA